MAVLADSGAGRQLSWWTVELVDSGASGQWSWWTVELVDIGAGGQWSWRTLVLATGELAVEAGDGDACVR